MQHTFRDAQFMSAAEKALVLKAWLRFLTGGLRYADFSKRLYEHLHLHCSFIAHYNRMGFYQTYFETGEGIVRFLGQFDIRAECHSIEYGGMWWLNGDYADLNRALVEEGAAHIPRLIEQAQACQRDADIAQARELLAKHGLPLP